jgi:hypothetical protein
MLYKSTARCVYTLVTTRHRLVEGGNKRKGDHAFPSHRHPLVGRVLVFVKDKILGKDKLISAVAIVNIAH